MSNNIQIDNKLLIEIIEDFKVVDANIKLQLKNLPEEYKAYWVNSPAYGRGVAIEIDLKDESLHEGFQNTEIQYITNFFFEGTRSINVLFFYMTEKYIKNFTDDYIIYAFANICCTFVHPSYREKLVNDPKSFWESLKTLLGNASKTQSAYPVVAELIAYNYLLSKGKQNIIWTGGDKKRIDFDFEGGKLEVKSTLSRTEKKCTIHGLDQLENGIQLIFFVMENSEDIHAISIDSMIMYLSSKYDVDKKKLEDQIASMGFIQGSSVRKIKFNVLHAYMYNIDNKFPRITTEILGDNISYRTSNIQYDLSLEGLEHIDKTKEINEFQYEE